MAEADAAPRKDVMAIDRSFAPPPPSLGRIVHYCTNKRQIIAAIVSEVIGDPENGIVNLTTIPPGQQSGFPSHVRLGGAGQPNTWFWPPRV